MARGVTPSQLTSSRDSMWQAQTRFEPWHRTTLNFYCSFFPWLKGREVDEWCLVQETYRRVVRVQLALLAWRHGHGQFPETLDALVGPYFDQLPLDPCCGRPFRYKPLGWPREVRWVRSNAFNRYGSVRTAERMAIVIPAGCPFLWTPGDVADPRSQSDEPPTMQTQGNVRAYYGYVFPLDPRIAVPTSR